MTLSHTHSRRKKKLQYLDIPFLIYQIDQNVKYLIKHTTDGGGKADVPILLVHWKKYKMKYGQNLYYMIAFKRKKGLEGIQMFISSVQFE